MPSAAPRSPDGPGGNPAPVVARVYSDQMQIGERARLTAAAPIRAPDVSSEDDAATVTPRRFGAMNVLDIGPEWREKANPGVDLERIEDPTACIVLCFGYWCVWPAWDEYMKWKSTWRWILVMSLA